MTRRHQSGAKNARSKRRSGVVFAPAINKAPLRNSIRKIFSKWPQTSEFMTIKVIHIVEAYCLYYAAEQSIKINDLSEHLVMLQEHIKKIDKAAFGNLLKPIKI